MHLIKHLHENNLSGSCFLCLQVSQQVFKQPLSVQQDTQHRMFKCIIILIKQVIFLLHLAIFFVQFVCLLFNTTQCGLALNISSSMCILYRTVYTKLCIKYIKTLSRFKQMESKQFFPLTFFLPKIFATFLNQAHQNRGPKM